MYVLNADIDTKKQGGMEMIDFYEDFDDFDGGDFMDDDSFEDGLDENIESEDLTNDDSGIEEESTGDDICNDKFTMEDAVMSGIAFG